MPVASRSVLRLSATVALCAIARAACVQKPTVPAAPTAPVAESGPQTEPGNPITENKPTFLTLPNMSNDRTPVRVGIILPFTSGTPAVKALAQAMLKSAEMAVYESGNRDIVLMMADEGSTPSEAANAADRLLRQGAEIIVGPLYGPSAKA